MLIVTLALLSGTLSGFLFEQDCTLLPGALFALAVIAGSFMRYEKVGLLRILAIAVVSTLANYAAVHAAIYVDDSFGKIQTLTGAAGGLVGGTLLGLGAAIVFRLRPIGRTMLLIAGVGTALGSVFFLLPHPALGYALWQGGAAWAIHRRWTR